MDQYTSWEIPCVDTKRSFKRPEIEMWIDWKTVGVTFDGLDSYEFGITRFPPTSCTETL